MSTIITTSSKYRLNKSNLDRILKVAGWTMLSGALAALADFIPMIEFPAMYAFLGGIINILIFSAIDFVKEQTVTN